MQLPLQVTFIGLPSSDAIEANIRNYSDKMERICNDIISCRVSVESDGKHKHKGRAYKICIDITVPSDEIVVNHHYADPDSGDTYAAVHHAFDAATRQLSEYVQRRRREIKAHSVP